MTLEELRSKALFQNTIDTWIMLCDEKKADWYLPEDYKKFISHLFQSGLKLQKFPLCIKESGGMYQRGRDKTQFAETLAQSTDPNAAAYTIRLSDDTIKIIRKFNSSVVATKKNKRIGRVHNYTVHFCIPSHLDFYWQHIHFHSGSKSGSLQVMIFSLN